MFCSRFGGNHYPLAVMSVEDGKTEQRAATRADVVTASGSSTPNTYIAAHARALGA